MSKKQAEELKPTWRESIKRGWNTFWEAVKTIPNIWTNTQHLIEAICLVTVAGFTFWGSYQLDFAIDNSAYALRFASVVIALRGATEFLKQMNKRGE